MTVAEPYRSSILEQTGHLVAMRLSNDAALQAGF